MMSLFLFVAGAAAWYFSTVAAGGAATLLVPVLGVVLGAEMVAPLISVAALCANPSRAWLFRQHVSFNVLRWLIPGSIAGAIVGAISLTTFPAQTVQLLLGLFLLSFVFQDRLGRVRISLAPHPSLFLPLGFVIAWLSAVFGATGPILNPFLLSHGLGKEQLVGTKSVNSLLMQLTKLLAYGSIGILTIGVLASGLALGLGAIAGVWLAHNHLLNMDIRRFKAYTHSLMFISGIWLIFQSFEMT